MLIKRLATAIWGIPLILLLVYLGGIWFTMLVWLLAMVGIREYLKLLQPPSKLTYYFGYAWVTALLGVLHIGNEKFILTALTALFVFSALNLLFRFNLTSLEETTGLLWGILYVGGMLGFLILIRETGQIQGIEEGGLAITIYLFIVTWLNDTFAYFVGKKWGTIKFIPAISPNKSLQGSLGGLICTVIVITLIYFPFQESFPFSLGLTIALTFLVVILGQAGDLIESALKRKLDTKDSGGFLPGHGGILDRFDSILFAAPFVYFIIILM